MNTEDTSMIGGAVIGLAVGASFGLGGVVSGAFLGAVIGMRVVGRERLD